MDREDVNPILAHQPIDDPVWSMNNFADERVLEFRNGPTRLGKGTQPISRPEVRQRARLMGRSPHPATIDFAFNLPWPLPRAWRQRTHFGDVTRHEAAGTRARLSF